MSEKDVTQDLREAIGTQRGTLPHFTAASRSPASAHDFNKREMSRALFYRRIEKVHL